MNQKQRLKVGILVGGGPAPGINSVIRAATIKLQNHCIEVVGIYDGFTSLMQKDITNVKYLTIEDVSAIHFEGGSVLRTARANPTKRREDMENVLDSLARLKINCLITIGGDDTCFTAHTIAKEAEGSIQVIHVPKTIDNDINLPFGIRTFGFASARSFGVNIVKSIMNDAKTTGRWYFIIAMGRKAGHLALGIGSPAGATITVIPEECKSPKLDFQWLTDTLIGSVLKRKAAGRNYGVAILAEGLAEKLTTEELADMGQLEYDEHGHPRLAEIDFGKVIKTKVREELAEMGVKITIVDKDIGYELRCVDPVPFDMEYTKELGFAAAKHAILGGSGDMVSIQDGKFVPIPFYAIMDPGTGKTKVRMVDIRSEAYEMALEYMIRLIPADFKDQKKVEQLAQSANMNVDEFRERFEPVAARFEGQSTLESYMQPVEMD